ncbi:hypothetical protein D3C87_1159380 [compost metagenome]
MREHAQVGVQRLLRGLLAGQVHAHRRHLAGAEVVVAAGVAQLVLRDLLGLQAQHRQPVEVRAAAKHLARLGPGRIEQDEERTLRDAATGRIRRRRNPQHHALGRRVLPREHHIGLPLRVVQQRQQRGIGLGAGPAEGEGVGHHIGHQPPGVGGLERLDVGHEQAHPRARGHRRAYGAHAMAGHQAAARTALALETATGKKRLGAARQARGAKEGDGVRHAPILGGVAVAWRPLPSPRLTRCLGIRACEPA